MFKFRVRDPQGEQYMIEIDSTKQDVSGDMVVKAKSGIAAAAEFRSQIVGSYGAFGHIIGNPAHAEDVHAFLAGLKQKGWTVKSLGQSVGTYKSPPEGAVF